MREEHASLYHCVFVCMLVVCVAVRVCSVLFVGVGLCTVGMCILTMTYSNTMTAISLQLC